MPDFYMDAKDLDSDHCVETLLYTKLFPQPHSYCYCSQFTEKKVDINEDHTVGEFQNFTLNSLALECLLLITCEIVADYVERKERTNRQNDAYILGRHGSSPRRKP